MALQGASTTGGYTLCSCTPIPEGYAVRVPYLLRTAFKSSFPSAVPLADQTWTVDQGESERLEHWLAEVEGSGLKESFQARCAAKLSLEEVQRLHGQIMQLRVQVDQQTSVSKVLAQHMQVADASLAILESVTGRLAELSAANDSTAAALAQRHEMIENILAGIIDLAGARQSAASMGSLHGDASPKAWVEYQAAQEVIRAAKLRLRAAGLRLEALDLLAVARMGHHCDQPGHLPTGAWLKLTPA